MLRAAPSSGSALTRAQIVVSQVALTLSLHLFESSSIRRPRWQSGCPLLLSTRSNMPDGGSVDDWRGFCPPSSFPQTHRPCRVSPTLASSPKHEQDRGEQSPIRSETWSSRRFLITWTRLRSKDVHGLQLGFEVFSTEVRRLSRQLDALPDCVSSQRPFGQVSDQRKTHVLNPRWIYHGLWLQGG